MAKVFNLTIKACEHKCDQCLFTKNTIVDAKRKRELIKELKATDQHFWCHKGTMSGDKMICVGGIEAGLAKDLMAKALFAGIIKFVNPDKLKTPQ